MKTFKQTVQLPFGEEIGNAVSHAIGATAMLVLLPICAVYSYIYYDITQVVGISIFIISLFLMFLSSTIYHTMAYGSTHKYILRIIDHSMIYIAIAGSYTPVALTVIGGWLGYTIIVLQWGITIFGILYKIFATHVNEKFSLTLYIIMGWLIIFIMPKLIKQTSAIFLLLMVIGGVLYTIGAWFYAQKKPYFHMIWHLFILAAAIVQFIAIVFYMR